MPTVTAEEFKALLRADWSEAEFQQAVIDRAHDLGWTADWFRNVRIQRADGSVYYALPVAGDGEGHSDLMLARERVVFMELKVKRNRPSPRQRAWAERMRRARAEVYTFWPKDWDDLDAVLRRRDEYANKGG